MKKAEHIYDYEKTDENRLSGFWNMLINIKILDAGTNTKNYLEDQIKI